MESPKERRSQWFPQGTRGWAKLPLTSQGQNNLANLFYKSLGDNPWPFQLYQSVIITWHKLTAFEMCFGLMLLVKKKKFLWGHMSCSVLKICFINGVLSFIGWSSNPRSGKFIKEGSQGNVPTDSRVWRVVPRVYCRMNTIYGPPLPPTICDMFSKALNICIKQFPSMIFPGNQKKMWQGNIADMDLLTER